MAPAIAAEFGLPGREDEIADVSRRALASEVIARALRSKRVLREAAFSAPLPHGDEPGLAEGRIDLLFEEDGEIVIVDFKTDSVTAAEVEARTEHYRRQALVYAWAVRQATGMAAREVVFLFARAETERRMLCDAAFMEEAEALMRDPTADLEEEVAL
jgi:ATP-dependent exoDNAse (exonuclease V) beta subunit